MFIIQVNLSFVEAVWKDAWRVISVQKNVYVPVSDTVEIL